ncbi:hypothetical protein HGRIS_008151 [Hohenbuehelia grisea]|uniref:Uncharacterized protein n=1 Tax=Hohenbuehelia grisea TaxID=104357 RepID=A0ABR3J7I6_9AGAR
MGSSPDIRLTFRERSFDSDDYQSDKYSIASTTLASFSTTSFTTEFDGLGADLGRFLYWFGTHVLDAGVRITIRSRFVAISFFVSLVHRKGTAPQLATDRVKGMCADLLELCRPVYSLRVRRRSLTLMLALLQPVTSLTGVILSSDFFSVLMSCGLNECRDPVIIRVLAQIEFLNGTVSNLPCPCTICMRTLRNARFRSITFKNPSWMEDLELQYSSTWLRP